MKKKYLNRFLSIGLVSVLVAASMSSVVLGEEELLTSGEDLQIEYNVEESSDEEFLISDEEELFLPDEDISYEEEMIYPDEDLLSSGEDEEILDISGGDEVFEQDETIESGTCGEQVSWTLDAEGVLHIEGVGPMTDYEDYKHWTDNGAIRRVIISEGVTTIGENMFNLCSNLRSIELPDSLIAIGESAFGNCSDLKNIELPENCTEIGEYSFSWAGLESIQLPNSLQRIGMSAFSNCASLKRIEIPSSITEIDSFTFENCESLTQIIIPKQVEQIGYEAFDGCKNLKNVYVWNPNLVLDETGIGYEKLYMEEKISGFILWGYQGSMAEKYAAEENFAFSFLDSFATGAAGEHITWLLDDTGVLKLNGYGAMYDNVGQEVWLNDKDRIQKIVISEGITSIGSSAFAEFTALTEIEVPNTVKSIGDSALQGCSVLENILLPDSVESIGRRAFYGCHLLRTLDFSGNINYLGEESLKDCLILSEIYIRNASLDLWESGLGLSESNVKFSVVIHGCGESPAEHYAKAQEFDFEPIDLLASGIAGEHITWNLYESGKLRLEGEGPSIDYKYSNNWIGTTGYTSHQNKVKQVFVSEGITSIGNHMFSNCYNLNSVDLPDSVTVIGEQAFRSCDNLKTIVLPGNCVEIGEFSFSWAGLESIQLPDSLQKIGLGAFYGCTSLSSIDIPASVTEIDGSVFKSCKSLTQITIPEHIEKIYSDAFENCINLKSIYVWNRNLDLENTGIGYENLFENKKLDGVMIYGAGESAAETYAEENEFDFIPLDLVASGTCGDQITWKLYEYGILRLNGSGKMVDVSGKTFWGYDDEGQLWADRIHTVLISEGITGICDNAFADFSALTTLQLPDSLEIIGKNAFRNDKYLKAAVLPNNLQSVGESAFQNCSLIEEISLAEKVTSLGSQAFAGCENLLSATVENEDLFLADSGLGYDAAGQKISGFALHGKEISTTEQYATEREFEFYQLDYIMKGGSKQGDKDVWWTMDATGVLRIYGTGKLYDLSNGSYGGEYFKSEWLPKIKKVIIQEGITVIGQQAFRECTALTSVKLPESVEALWEQAFSGCSSLKEINLSESLTFIDKYAFHGCESLTSVRLPESIYKIDQGTFGSCKSLQEIIFPSSLEEIGHLAFANCESLEQIQFPGSLTKIDREAFENCTSLKEISIPSNVESIGRDAFDQCPNLKIVKIYNPNVEIGNWAFGFLDLQGSIDDLALYGYEGSTTQDYAKCYGFTFRPFALPSEKKTLVFKALSNTDAGIKLEWDKISNVDEYFIYRKNESGQYEKISAVQNTNFLDTEAENGESYSYRVQTYSNGMTASWNEISVSRFVFSDILAANESKGIQLNWEVSNKDINTYSIYRRANTSEYELLGSVKGTLDTYTDTTAKDGITYTYKVIGTMTEKEFVETETEILRLSNPVIKSATNTMDGIKLTWNSVDGAKGYNIYRVNSSGSLSRLGNVVGETSYTDTNVASGKSYTYAVKAYKGKFSSKYNTIKKSFLSGVKTKAYNNKTGMSVTWNKVANASGYRVYRKSASGKESYKLIATVSASKTSYLDAEKLVGGRAYMYAVRAYRGSVTSSYTAATMRSLTAPKLTLTTSSKKVQLKWTKVSGAKGYYIYRKTGKGSYVKIASVTGIGTLRYIDTTASKGKTYSYAVRAYNGGAMSAYLDKTITVK